MVPLFIVCVALVVFIQQVRALLLRHKLKQRGKHTMAEVIDVSSRVRSGRRRSVTYVYTLEYMTEGERQTVKHSMGRRQSYVAGDKVEIAYLPEDPGKLMLAELLPNSIENLIHFAAGIVGILFFLVVFAYNFQRIGRMPKFPSFGSVTPPIKHTQELINLYGSGTPREIEAGADVTRKKATGKSQRVL